GAAPSAPGTGPYGRGPSGAGVARVAAHRSGPTADRTAATHRGEGPDGRPSASGGHGRPVVGGGRGPGPGATGRGDVGGRPHRRPDRAGRERRRGRGP